MGTKQIILDLIEAELEGTDLFVVKTNSNEFESNMQFYIDGVDGVGISECAKIGRRVSAQLDEMELVTDKYRYEISSPGADKPLTDIRQYHKHKGRTLDVSLGDGTLLSGELTEVNDAAIELNVVIDKKKKINKKQTIDFKDIECSIVQISFKSIKK